MESFIPELEQLLGWTLGMVWVVGLALGSLVFGTLIRLLANGRRTDAKAVQRERSLKSWWVLVGVFVALLAVGPVGVMFGVLLAAGFGLAELFTFTQADEEWNASRLRVRGSLFLLLGVGGVGAVLFASPLPDAARGEILASILFLVLLTECNDIFQAWTGRQIGRRKLAPKLSPGKTWEGLAGGILGTTLLSLAFSPLLLPQLPWYWAIAFGITLSIAGLLGDLAESSIKRAAGVKDSGDLLPGQGGMMDRIDSLCFTAPMFWVLLWIAYG